MRFTVRRPANAEVSPCCHRPSGGDVACSVHVGVARPCVAGFAFEDRLALAVPGSDVPARRASLRRVRGRNLLDPTISLVLQTRGQKTPTASVDSLVQTALLGDPQTGLLDRSARSAGHRPYGEGFDADRVEATRNVRGCLFDPIFATVSLTSLQFRDRQLRASSPVRAALGAGQPLLQHLDPPGLAAAQARGVQQFTGRQSRRHHNAAVDTHHGAPTRASDGFRDVSERDMPAASPITSDPVRLRIVRNGPRQAEAHPADFRYPHTAQSAVETLDVVRFDRDLPKSLVHTGFAPRRAAVCSSGKVAHSLGEVPQSLLLHGLGASREPVVHGAGRGQLSALLVIAGRVATGLPMLLLLDRQVPHIPGMTTMLSQHHLLLRSRKQPKSRHARNVAACSDKSPKGAAFAPGYTHGFHVATAR